MRICTITCHDVYNHGASLQAYALEKYLQALGHDVRIIDYKPDYLSGHFRLDTVGNPKYDKPLLRQAYLLAKLPGRLRMLPRKAAFDRFTSEYLDLTRRYSSNEELKADPPEVDVYFAGSDQIWNPLFPNGKDPAFYLDFASHGVKASYAASFAVDLFPAELRKITSGYLRRFDKISVRERSGLSVLESLGIKSAACVLDPVFLPEPELWDAVAKQPCDNTVPYLLVYDFDNNPLIKRLAQRTAAERGLAIYSVFDLDYADRCFPLCGPQEFLGLMRSASFVLSNSFHATAFSVIFEKDFAVVERKEKINTRMRDFADMLGLSHRIMSTGDGVLDDIDWCEVKRRLSFEIVASRLFIDEVLESKA